MWPWRSPAAGVSKKVPLTTLMSRLGSDVEGGQRGPQRLGRQNVRGAGLGSLATLRVISVLRRPVQGLGHVEPSQRGRMHRGRDVTVAQRVSTPRMSLYGRYRKRAVVGDS